MSPAYWYVNGIVDTCDASVHDAVMAEDKDPRIITPMPQKLLAEVDDFRFERRLPSRAEAIRRLIELGLKAAAGEREPTKDEKSAEVG